MLSSCRQDVNKVRAKRQPGRGAGRGDLTASQLQRSKPCSGEGSALAGWPRGRRPGWLLLPHLSQCRGDDSQSCCWRFRVPHGEDPARSEVLLQVRQAILVFFLLREKTKTRAGHGLCRRKGRVLLMQLRRLFSRCLRKNTSRVINIFEINICRLRETCQAER